MADNSNGTRIYVCKYSSLILLLGGMNNYKGVMLCSRPNEPAKAPQEKPFCSRVEGQYQVGLNPVKKDSEHPVQNKPKKKINMALQRHKDWLDMYKLKMNLKKEEGIESQIKQEELVDKVKEMAAQQRVKAKKMKQDYDQANIMIEKVLEKEDQKKEKQQNTNDDREDSQKKLIEEKLKREKDEEISNKKTEKKKEQAKPKWAKTEKEEEEDEEQECEDLLAFASGLDYDQYINDLEVQSMVKAIKSRVNELSEKVQKQQQNERKMEREKERENKKQQNQDDMRSNAGSAVSASESILSERSQQSIESLKDKLNDQKKGKSDWDVSSKGEDKIKASIEERIAKHVADEVLRNYKHLGAVHSNQSIRKLLEKEAQNAIATRGVQGPLISIVKETTLRKNEIDPNNLPYLHRNPAI